MLLYSDTNYALEVHLLKLVITIILIFIICRGSLQATQPTSVLTIAAAGELATKPQTLASVHLVGSIVMMVIMIIMTVMMIVMMVKMTVMTMMTIPAWSGLSCSLAVCPNQCGVGADWGVCK